MSVTKCDLAASVTHVLGALRLHLRRAHAAVAKLAGLLLDIAAKLRADVSLPRAMEGGARTCSPVLTAM